MKTMLLAACLVLSGCAGVLPPDASVTRAGPVTHVALSSQIVQGKLAYGAPTVDAARRAFFGDDTDPGGSGDGGGGGGDLINPQQPVALHGLPPTVTQLTLSRQDQIGGVTVTTSAMAGYHHLSGTLPQGLGVLTDPMRIDIWAQSLGLQVTFGRQLALPRGLHLAYAAGGGLSQIRAATHLQSVLIDLRGKSRQTLPYAVLEARLRGATGPALSGGLWVFQSGAREIRLGVEQRF